MSNSKIYLGSTNLVAGKIKLGSNDVSAIYLGTSLLYPPTTPQPTPPSLSDCVCFEALDTNTSIRLHASQDYSFFPVNLWYSTDGGTTFSKMDRLTPITLPNIGDKMYVYGSNVSLGQSNLNYVRFLIYDGDVSVSGDLTRLLNPNGLTTLPDYAFVKTFSNNTHLADVSGLTIPVTTVGKSSLAGLFDGCSNITTAPTLPATTLGEGCYEEMFYGCSNLNYIKVGATTWNTSWAGNWVQNVAATGTFVKPVDLTIGTGTGEIPSDSVNGIPIGWTVQNTNDYLCFTAEEANATIGMVHNGTNQTTTQPVMYYSTDKTNWTLWDYSNITLTNAGDKVYFYGNNPNGFSSSSSNYSKFTTSGSVACSGNIMTLITRDGSETTIPSDYCFTELFSGASIVSAANLSLPATTLTDFCYYAMFYVCSHLTTGPSVLPATSIPHSAYEYMFMDCYSLTAAPDIQAQVAGGASCDYMFKNCSSLTTVPSIPSILNGGSTCYQMFMGCTSLVNLQHLRITTISSQSCVGMFKNCTALTTSPILEDETLIASCYEEMFYGCSSLNSVTCLATDVTAYNSTNNWLYGVSATGTFTKNASMSNWPTGISGIPTGWTVQNYNPMTQAECVTTSYSMAAGTFIDTGIYPTIDTVFKVKYKPITTNDTCVVGFAPNGTPTGSGSDSKDYRFFFYESLTQGTFDFNSSRINGNLTQDTDGYLYVEVGNNYIKDLNTGQTVTTGSAQSSMQTTTVPMYLDLSNSELMHSLEIWEGQTKVYDGYAAHNGTNYGWYDSISNTFTRYTYGNYEIQGPPDCSDCANNWELCGYSSYYNCECNENDHCVDCENDWESEGFESYEDCDCQVNGNCLDCSDCTNWSECGYESYEDCDCQVNGECHQDCDNWEDMGYGSYEDCDCQVNGNCNSDPCQECFEQCGGDPECEATCTEEGGPCGG